MSIELTLSIIKPDAVARSLTGSINSIFEKNDLKIVAQRMILLSKKDAELFYGVHKDRSFFKDLCDYMTSGPIIVQVLQGENAVAKNRELMGATNPVNAEKNTIRNLFGKTVEENSVHGSDSNENAELEIKFFFSLRDILN